MWPAVRAYRRERFDFHFGQIIDACPDVVGNLNKDHNNLWSGSVFSTEIKCDYVNNNLAECFNSWIKNIKDLPVVNLIDRLRQMTMELWEKRRKIADKLSCSILPVIISELKAKTKGLGYMSVFKNCLFEISLIELKGGGKWRLHFHKTMVKSQSYGK